jgi:hypothetical protein
MGRQSSIKCNPAIRQAVDDAIGRGCTIDAITTMIAAMGAEIGRSSVHRYAQKYQAVAQRQRDIRAAADAFAGEFGTAEDKQTKLMIQLVTTLITENILSKGEGEGSAMDLRLLAAAVKDAIAAAKLDDDRIRAIRATALAEAAKEAEQAGRAEGASAAQIDAIKRRIMGLA